MVLIFSRWINSWPEDALHAPPKGGGFTRFAAKRKENRFFP